MGTFNADLLKRLIKDFSEPVKVAAEIVVKTGTELLSAENLFAFRDAGVKAGDEKKEPQIQFFTKADLYSQERILRDLSQQFPDARFITEEKVEGYCVPLIQGSNLSEIYEAPLVFGVDPLDGTNQARHDLYEWCISVGVMSHGEHLGGVIYAPAIRGGVVVVGERGRGVFLSEWGGTSLNQVSVFSEGTFYTGIGLSFFPEYNRFINNVAKDVLVKSTGSCALGLAMIAAGRVGVMVQSAQRPYDWFGGYSLVLEAGGKFQFYHHEDGRIVPLEEPDLPSYDPDKLRTGFIAGHPDLVDKYFELLLKQWG